MNNQSKLEQLNLKLGRQTQDTQLDSVPRDIGRNEITKHSFRHGYDLWNAWEAGYLSSTGIPVSFILQIAYACTTPSIVESKSLKLYLNHLNDMVFQSQGAYLTKVKSDLEHCIGGAIELSITAAGCFHSPISLSGLCLEEHLMEQQIQVDAWNKPEAGQIKLLDFKKELSYYSHVFRSNCPVTGQPDWGSIQIQMTNAKKPDTADLLSYLKAFRHINEFHETCCERIYTDLYSHCQAADITVSCFFTRRGGCDINPARSSSVCSINWGQVHWRQ